MSLILEQIDSATRRLDFDVADQIQSLQSKTPGDIATNKELTQREQFLRRSLGDEQLAVETLERVLAGNELQPVNYLERGAIAARAVARILIREPNGRQYGWGTGFLIAPQVLITNNHVLPSSQWAVGSEAQFDYEINIKDELIGPTSFQLAPQQLFYTSKDLDFTVVAVATNSEDRQHTLSQFSWLPLLDTPGKSFEGEWLTIVQHPAGERKQLCVRENRLLKRADDVLWYSTDTLGGSSGSPVYNNDWFVVALHHSGVPEKKNDKIQTIDGRDFNPQTMDETQIKWVANEGIRASRITQTLKQVLPNHPLLQPLFSATPESSRIVGSTLSDVNPQPISLILPPSSQPRNDTPMSQDSLQTFTIPLQISLQISAPAGISVAGAQASPLTSRESATFPQERAETSASSGERQARFDAPFDSNYDNRKGYNPEFLGAEHRVGFPKMTPALASEVTKLLEPQEKNENILHYHNYSVVIHKKRRFAIYSAANVSFANRFALSRPRDVWRLDPRIPSESQVGEFYYARNQFDRGHLTRREDLEFGKDPNEALASAGDTCHFTNCTPQHSGFNQSKEIWQGIERHVLEEAIINGHFNAQIITGSVFDESDPLYRNIQYPLQYWKVVAALNAKGKLFATAYLASQADVIDRLGIEAAPEVPFGPFKTFQVKLSEIERLTGLSFVYGKDNKSLSDHDPLKTAQPRRRSSRFSPTESTSLGWLPPGYIELTELDDIVT